MLNAYKFYLSKSNIILLFVHTLSCMCVLNSDIFTFISLFVHIIQ